VEAHLVGLRSRTDEVQRFQPWSVGLCSAVQSEGVFGCLSELILLSELGDSLVMAFLRRFYVEAKSFELSVGEGASVLRLEEKRKGLSNVLCLGSLGVGWLASTVENLVAEPGSKEFVKSLREGPKKFIAQERF
jgi:hypothetical protein